VPCQTIYLLARKKICLPGRNLNETVVGRAGLDEVHGLLYLRCDEGCPEKPDISVSKGFVIGGLVPV
jgi:hypothetical protein